MPTTSYHDSELEHVPAVLLGGPLDGQRYSMPVFPDGGIPNEMSAPLGQPAAVHPAALYRRTDDTPIAGYYLFYFVEIIEPDAVAAAEKPIRTCAGSARKGNS